MGRGLRKKDSSISDSDDEFNNNYYRNESPPPSVLGSRGTTVSPTKQGRFNNNRLADDPMLLLKTKLKQTHSLSNLPAGLLKEKPPPFQQLFQQPSSSGAGTSEPGQQLIYSHPNAARDVLPDLEADNFGFPESGSVYHTVHGGGVHKRNNVLDPMDLLGGGGGGWGTGGEHQSDSTCSSGYKTVGPYYGGGSGGGGYDESSSALSRFLKERQRSRLLDYHYYYLVREVPATTRLNLTQLIPTYP